MGGGRKKPKPPEQPDITSRREWGALLPGTQVSLLQNPRYDEGLYSSDREWGYMDYSISNPGTPLSDVINSIVIHWEGDSSVMDNGFLGATGIRKLQEQAMENGLYDIQYHIVIDPAGVIYEGRNIGVRGAHVSGEAKNSGKIGILWMGVSSSRGGVPTEAQFSATVKYALYADYAYGISEVISHRAAEQSAGSYTECPGDSAIPFVDQLNSMVQGGQ
ncbi:MAG: hypothetical protein DRI65_08860 [Chloroflexota bacterium]|nr:MAG: hypothetical protein DRI65_08860 [Chloroflexota bacterium]